MNYVYLFFGTFEYQHAEFAFPLLSLPCLAKTVRQLELPSCKWFLPDLRTYPRNGLICTLATQTCPKLTDSEIFWDFVFRV